MLFHLIRELAADFESKNDFTVSICLSRGTSASDTLHWRSKIRRPAASLIKLFLLGAVEREMIAGTCSPTQSVTIEDSTHVGGSGLLKFMSMPLKVSISDLVYLMMAYSDNIAANAIARIVSLERVNEFIADAGMKDSKMASLMMPSKAQSLGAQNTTTATDVALFYQGIVNGFHGSIRPSCSAECLRILSETKGTPHQRIKFLASSFNLKGIRRVFQRAPLVVPVYLGAATQSQRRLTLRVPDHLVGASKAGTGRTVMHDSCLFWTEPPSILAVLIESQRADFRNPRSDEYQSAVQFCSEVGWLASEL